MERFKKVFNLIYTAMPIIFAIQALVAFFMGERIEGLLYFCLCYLAELNQKV
jgi:hypothetical protein